jgi:hypothetical protein
VLIHCRTQVLQAAPELIFFLIPAAPLLRIFLSSSRVDICCGQSSPALSSAPRWLEKSWLPMVISSQRRPWGLQIPRRGAPALVAALPPCVFLPVPSARPWPSLGRALPAPPVRRVPARRGFLPARRSDCDLPCSCSPAPRPLLPLPVFLHASVQLGLPGARNPVAQPSRLLLLVVASSSSDFAGRRSLTRVPVGVV